MVELGENKGYTPVSCTRNNVIFAHDSLAEEIGLDSKEYDDPSHLFLDEWVQPDPFYENSVTENISMIRSSIQKNGLSKTIRLGISRIRNSI